VQRDRERECFIVGSLLTTLAGAVRYTTLRAIPAWSLKSPLRASPLVGRCPRSVTPRRENLRRERNGRTLGVQFGEERAKVAALEKGVTHLNAENADLRGRVRVIDRLRAKVDARRRQQAPLIAGNARPNRARLVGEGFLADAEGVVRGAGAAAAALQEFGCR
jgi:hypothetical protein